MRIQDTAQIRTKITGIKQSAAKIRENVQITCLALVGHALKYGSSDLGTKLIAAVNPADKAYVGRWLEKYGPFAYDRADNSVAFSKARRKTIGADSDAEIEKLLDTLESEAEQWYEAKPKKQAAPESIDFLDNLEAWLKKSEKAHEANADVEQRHVNLLAEVKTLVLAFKRDEYDREHKLGKYAEAGGKTDSEHVVDVESRDVTPRGHVAQQPSTMLHLNAA